jgi:hypothetical protein
MNLIYSLDQHGISLSTLYRLVKPNKGPCVLVVKDADDNVSSRTWGYNDNKLILSRKKVFGAFLNEPLKPGSRYYGTGEW